MHRVLTARHQRATGRRQGLTLLELLIILGAVVIFIFIAIPTMHLTPEELQARQARVLLLYLFQQEQAYFEARGTYAPFTKIAQDEQLGPGFDARFNATEPIVDEIVFRGPSTEARVFEIIATLPDSTRYKIDQTGTVVPLQ